MKLKLYRDNRERRGGRKLYNTAGDQNVKEQFYIEIRNRFEASASDEVNSVEQGWLQLKKVYCESAYAALGERRSIKSNWISAETRRRMNEKR